jgi:phage protein D
MLTVGPRPAPPAVVSAVQEIEVESATDVAGMFRLRIGIARTDGGEWSTVDADLFQPLARVGIRIQAGTGPPTAVLNGFVFGQQVTYADEPGRSVLEITGMDATMLMSLSDRIAAWPNMSDSAIATAIFGRYFVVPKVQATAPALVEPEGTTLQRSSDIRFLRGLARRNGFECYVQPDPLTGLDLGFFRPPQTLGLPQAVLSVSLGSETNVRDFSVRYDMTQPTTVVAAGLDVQTKTPQPAAAPTGLEPPLGREPALLRLRPPPVTRPIDTGLMRTADLQRLSQAVVDRSSYAVVASGTVGADVGVLRPGRIVNVRGPGRVYTGSYYLTRVHHTIGAGGYFQRFVARRNAVGTTGAEVFLQP